MEEEHEVQRLKLIQQNRKRISELKDSHLVEMDKLKDNHAATIGLLKTKHQEEIDALNADWERRMKALQDKFDKERDEWRNSAGDMEKRLQEELEALKLKYAEL